MGVFLCLTISAIGYFLGGFLLMFGVGEAGVGIYAVESRYVVPPFSEKVSESRAGQAVGILKLAPRLMSKRQGKLIQG
jgi:hypothetical protein